MEPFGNFFREGGGEGRKGVKHPYFCTEVMAGPRSMQRPKRLKLKGRYTGGCYYMNADTVLIERVDMFT